MLFPYLIKVSFLLAILTLGYRWLVQFETFSKVNRLLLLFNLVAAWTLPLLPLPYWGPVKVQQQFHETMPVISEKFPRITETNVFSAPLQTSTVVPATSVTTTSVTKASDAEPSGADILLIIYLAGVLVLTSLLLFRIFSLIRHLRKLPTQKTNDFVLIYDQNLVAPYSFFKWIVLDPTAYTQNELQHILAHEAEHARNWHSIDLLLAELQKIALWFNPFAWYHSKLIQENLEFLADRAVLTIGFEKKPYQLNLLKIALNSTNLPLTNSFAQSILKKRIKMMNRKPSQLWVIGKYTLLLAVIYISSAFVAPYKQQLIQLAPAAMKPAIAALVPESLPEIVNNPVKTETKPKVVKADSVAVSSTTLPTPSLPEVPESPWLLKRNDTLYWAISAISTWEDIAKVREGIRSVGPELGIDAITFESQHNYISKLIFSVKSTNKSIQYNYVNPDTPYVHAPISPVIGYATANDINLSIKTTPKELDKLAWTENKKASNLFYKYQSVDKVRERLTVKGGGGGWSMTIFKGNDLIQTPERLLNSGITITENKLLVGAQDSDLELYLNRKSATSEKINEVLAEEIEEITMFKDLKTEKKYVIVITKNWDSDFRNSNR